MPKASNPRLITGDDNLDRKNLKILLIKNEITPTDIARDLGISPQAVYPVINRKKNSRRVFEYLENLSIQV